MTGALSFEAEVRRGRRLRCVAAALVDAAIAQPLPRLVLVKGAHKLLLSRNMSGDCEFRITDFGAFGPNGHREYRATDRGGSLGMDAEIMTAVLNGYRRERRPRHA